MLIAGKKTVFGCVTRFSCRVQVGLAKLGFFPRHEYRAMGNERFLLDFFHFSIIYLVSFFRLR